MYFWFIVRQNNGCLKVSRKFYIVLTSVISPVSHRPHFALPADCTHHSNHSIGKYRLTIQVTPSPGTSRLFLSQCTDWKKTCISRTPGLWKLWRSVFSPRLSLQLYRGGPEVYLRFISEKTNCRRFQRGSNTFQWGGGGGGGGGPNIYANFYRNPYNLWFSRGSGPPFPLWIRAWCWLRRQA